MSDDSKQSEKTVSELLPDTGRKVNELKSAARRQILDTLITLLDMAYQRSGLTKNTSKIQQRWFTIFGYLAQVSTRIVRDLEYEQLRSELDELKKKVLANDVTRLRRTILAPRHGARESTHRKHYTISDSN